MWFQQCLFWRQRQGNLFLLGESQGKVRVFWKLIFLKKHASDPYLTYLLLLPLRSNQCTKSNTSSKRIPQQGQGLCWGLHWRGSGEKGVSWQLLLLQSWSLRLHQRNKRVGTENFTGPCSGQAWIPLHERAAWKWGHSWWLVECCSGMNWLTGTWETLCGIPFPSLSRFPPQFLEPPIFWIIFYFLWRFLEISNSL